MFLLAFIEKIHRESGVDPDALRDEFLAAGRRVARDVLGDRPRIETTWNDENGTIEFRQVLVAIETVREPYRELSVERLRALGGDVSGIQPGEELELSVFFTSDDEAQAQELDAHFGGLLALSCSQRRLWAPLDDALIEVVHRHLPPRRWREGTLGHLFQAGEWLVGLDGESQGISVSIAGGIWKERPSAPDVATIHYGVTLRIERGGRALEIPAERTGSATAVATWASLAARRTQAGAVEKELVRVAQSLGKEAALDRLDGGAIAAALLAILLET